MPGGKLKLKLKLTKILLSRKMKNYKLTGKVVVMFLT
jgi:hypothetical protein